MSTYAQIKQAIAALPAPVPTDPSAVAAALNAQTVAMQNQPFPLSAARLIARQSASGDWARIVTRARMTANLPPTTAADMAILAAINVCAGGDSDVIDPANTATWTAWQEGVGALEASGDLSAATVAAIAALTTMTVPAWVPAIQAIDVATAQGIA